MSSAAGSSSQAAGPLCRRMEKLELTDEEREMMLTYKALGHELKHIKKAIRRYNECFSSNAWLKMPEFEQWIEQAKRDEEESRRMARAKATQTPAAQQQAQPSDHFNQGMQPPRNQSTRICDSSHARPSSADVDQSTLPERRATRPVERERSSAPTWSTKVDGCSRIDTSTFPPLEAPQSSKAGGDRDGGLAHLQRSQGRENARGPTAAALPVVSKQAQASTFGPVFAMAAAKGRRTEGWDGDSDGQSDPKLEPRMRTGQPGDSLADEQLHQLMHQCDDRTEHSTGQGKRPGKAMQVHQHLDVEGEEENLQQANQQGSEQGNQHTVERGKCTQQQQQGRQALGKLFVSAAATGRKEEPHGDSVGVRTAGADNQRQRQVGLLGQHQAKRQTEVLPQTERLAAADTSRVHSLPEQRALTMRQESSREQGSQGKPPLPFTRHETLLVAGACTAEPAVTSVGGMSAAGAGVGAAALATAVAPQLVGATAAAAIATTGAAVAAPQQGAGVAAAPQLSRTSTAELGMAGAAEGNAPKRRKLLVPPETPDSSSERGSTKPSSGARQAGGQPEGTEHADTAEGGREEPPTRHQLRSCPNTTGHAEMRSITSPSHPDVLGEAAEDGEEQRDGGAEDESDSDGFIPLVDESAVIEVSDPPVVEVVAVERKRKGKEPLLLSAAASASREEEGGPLDRDPTVAVGPSSRPPAAATSEWGVEERRRQDVGESSRRASEGRGGCQAVRLKSRLQRASSESVRESTSRGVSEGEEVREGGDGCTEAFAELRGQAWWREWGDEGRRKLHQGGQEFTSQAIQSVPKSSAPIAAAGSSASCSLVADREGGRECTEDEGSQKEQQRSCSNGTGKQMVAKKKQKKERRPFHDRKDISGGKEATPIPWENDINEIEPPSDWIYADKSFAYSDNISIVASSQRIESCRNCRYDCLARKSSCVCSQSTKGEYAYRPDGRLTDAMLRRMERERVAREEGDEEILHKCKGTKRERRKCTMLKGKKCTGHVMHLFITECGVKCKCGRMCGNRIVQRGITTSLKLKYLSECKGWGVLADEDIPRGTFVCEYIGEILTNNDQYVRNKKSGGVYPVELDADWAAEKEVDEEALTLDASKYGNVARFINHRCGDANLVNVPVAIDQPDHLNYHVAFFARRDVKAGEELTWDYGIDFDDNDHPIPAFPCICGSTLCRDRKQERDFKGVIRLKDDL